MGSQSSYHYIIVNYSVVYGLKYFSIMFLFVLYCMHYSIIFDFVLKCICFTKKMYMLTLQVLLGANFQFTDIHLDVTIEPNIKVWSINSNNFTFLQEGLEFHEFSSFGTKVLNLIFFIGIHSYFFTFPNLPLVFFISFFRIWKFLFWQCTLYNFF